MMTETRAEIELGKVLDNKIPNLHLNDLFDEACAGPSGAQLPAAPAKDRFHGFCQCDHRVPGSCIRWPSCPTAPAPIRRNSLRLKKSEEAHKAVVFGAKILAITMLELAGNAPEELKAVKRRIRGSAGKRRKKRAQ